MDAARAILISLGVVLHSAVIFSTNSSDLLHAETSLPFYTHIIKVIHSCRMESFFIISGFFSMMIIEKKGLNHFLKSRFTRLAIPLFFFGFTFNIIMVWFAEHYYIQTNNRWGLDYILGGGWLKHLWFLSLLLAYSLIAYLLFLIIKKPQNIFKNIKINLIVYSFIIAALTLVFRQIHYRIPAPPYGDAWLLFNKAKFMYYISFYFFGIVLYLSKSLYIQVTEKGWLSFISIFLFFVLQFIFGSNTDNHIPYIIRSGLSFSYSTLVIYLFYIFFNKKKKWALNLSESSYTIYLFHMPVIIILGNLILRMHLPHYLSFLIICFISAYLPIVLHNKLIVKSNTLSILFNGKKKKN